MRNIFSVAVSCIILLCGCSSEQPSQKSSAREITVWYWMVDRKQAFEELAKKYEQETSVKVNFKLFSSDIYAQKVIAAARAGSLPEIFGILGEKKMLASFIKANHILDLTPYMLKDSSAWKKRFYPQVLGQNSFEKNNIYEVQEGIYGVPIDMMNIQFLYNRELFQKAGLNPNQPPVTFEDFIQYARLVKEKTGAKGFACGWGEVWLMSCVFSEWAMNLLGEDIFHKTIQGKIPYTSPQWIEVFSLFDRLRQEDVLLPNIVSTINKEAEQYFADGKSAFSFDGSWCINIYQELNPKLSYGAFPLPIVSTKFPIRIWGGAGSSFMVSAISPQKEEAVLFLAWLTKPEQQKYLIQSTRNLPAIQGCEDTFSEAMKEFANDADKITHPNIWPKQEDSRVTEVIIKGLQQIVMGITTPEKVAEEVQKAKERIEKQQ